MLAYLVPRLQKQISVTRWHYKQVLDPRGYILRHGVAYSLLDGRKCPPNCRKLVAGHELVYGNHLEEDPNTSQLYRSSCGVLCWHDSGAACFYGMTQLTDTSESSYQLRHTFSEPLRAVAVDARLPVIKVVTASGGVRYFQHAFTHKEKAMVTQEHPLAYADKIYSDAVLGGTDSGALLTDQGKVSVYRRYCGHPWPLQRTTETIVSMIWAKPYWLCLGDDGWLWRYNDRTVIDEAAPELLDPVFPQRVASMTRLFSQIYLLTLEGVLVKLSAELLLREVPPLRRRRRNAEPIDLELGASSVNT